MTLRIVAAAAAAAMLASAALPATAEQFEPGQEIYMLRCAVCHGAEGGGDGIVGALLERRPKNLRMLAAESNGAFPFSEVYQAIDGRRQIAGHGNPDMPIWGEFFMEQAIADRTANPKDARDITLGRILAVVYCLETIQTR
jgi:mono/diheme cytochrome c family protein